MSSDYCCCSCGAQAVSVFYEVKDVPVHSCLLMSTRRQALEFPRGDIALGFCRECGFISNISFNPSMLDYSLVYEDQQCFSSTFNAFAQGLAKRLIKKYNLRNKDILEIGCGKGDFLVLLCELGHNCGVGIDPAYTEGRTKSSVSDHLTFIRDYYSEHYANLHGDFVCCRHTLEHIYNTNGFVRTVRNAIGNRLDTVVFFEVPDVVRVLSELAFWDIYYEHCSYFSLGSLARLFRSCRFEITDLCKDFDNQYLLVEAKPTGQASWKMHELEERIEDIAKDVIHFSKLCCDRRSEWKTRLQKIHDGGKRVIVWGSGSKCVSFMTTLGVKNEIEYVVDINPHRHGKFIPGTGQKIMPPEFVKKYKPDVTIVMNPVYLNEIRRMLDDMGVTSDVIPV
jgi:SAM-dependent methyltransferase